MATDTAFAAAVIAMMGSRVPVELRILLTAASIVDDIGAIIVVAAFYSGELHLEYLGAAVCRGIRAGAGQSLAHLSRTAVRPAWHRAMGLCPRQWSACNVLSPYRSMVILVHVAHPDDTDCTQERLLHIANSCVT
jgi:hypothetical protein